MAWTDAARAASLAVRRAHAKSQRGSRVTDRRLRTVYHWTEAKNVPGILVRGFRPVGREHVYDPTYYRNGRRNAVFVVARKTDWVRRVGRVAIKLRVPWRKLHSDHAAWGPGQFYLHGVSARRIVSIGRPAKTFRPGGRGRE